MSLDESVRQEINDTIQSNEVVLFMKGNRRSPQCGFSATVVGILDSMLESYHTVDVLSAPDIRDGIKTFSSWPTIPQLYVKGEFVGGCDIIQEMMAGGELYETLGLEPVEVVQPKITVSETAAQALAQATAEHGGGGRELHLSVDATYQAHLSIAPRTPADVEAIVSGGGAGTTLLLDPMSAGRADGISTPVAAVQAHHVGIAVQNAHAVKAKRGRRLAGQTESFRGRAGCAVWHPGRWCRPDRGPQAGDSQAERHGWRRPRRPAFDHRFGVGLYRQLPRLDLRHRARQAGQHLCRPGQ